MTTSSELKKPVQPVQKETFWSKEEKGSMKEKYGCEILVENGNNEQVTTKQSPTDSYIIKYVCNDNIHYDLARGTKIKLFDMYWDKFKGGLKSISYGHGTIKPNLWGYQSTTTKKKKRKG